MEVDVNYKIREVRTLKGYNQLFIAKKLKISQRAYSKIELGQTQLKWSFLNQIAEILEVNIWELIGESKKSIEETPRKNIELLEQLINKYEQEINSLKKEIMLLKQGK